MFTYVLRLCIQTVICCIPCYIINYVRLPKMFEFQRAVREFEFNLIIATRCIKMVEAFRDKSVDDRENDHVMMDIIADELKLLQREVKDNKIEVNRNLREIEKLKKVQAINKNRK